VRTLLLFYPMGAYRERPRRAPEKKSLLVLVSVINLKSDLVKG